MTEQTEDDFWAQERARAAAERGRQADPSACGTCRTRVAVGDQVEHDECAQRATLLQAPDHPDWELITGMTEEEVWALPARFHVPVFLDTCRPKAWVCAVCWGDGWNTQWPCKTAQEHGTSVFTPEHEAETAAKKQAARVAELEKQLAEYEPLNPQQCPKGLHADWLVDSEYTHACPWCRIAELEAELARVTRPSYSNRHVWSVWREEQPIHAFYGTADDARQGSIDYWEEDEPSCPDYSWRKDGPRLELLVGGEASGVYISRNDVHGTLSGPDAGPTLPWAHAMDDSDLHEFLGDLVSAAMGRWRSEPEVPDRTVLADIEKVCADWRTPGQGHRSDEPDTKVRRT
jgi:hypothetical protein